MSTLQRKGLKRAAAVVTRRAAERGDAEASEGRILIVDDDERNLFALATALEDLAKVATAKSGEDALQHLLNGDFAVILLDVIMPGLDGYDTAALIRARERSRHIPIIFLTAVNKDDAHMLRGYAMGAVDYVFKPIEPVILRSKVAVFVDLYNKRLEIRRKAEQEQKLFEENLRVRTEKFRAEQALRHSEERQAAIIKSLPIALYTGRPDHGVHSPQFTSDRIAGLAGFSAEDFRHDAGLWIGRIHPEDRDRTLRAFAQVGSTGGLAVEYRWRCADDRYRFFLDQAVLVPRGNDASGEIFGTWLDVTERRELEQQLVRAQKMDAMGKLTGGVAHDFNNMLTIVIGSLGQLKKSLSDDVKSLRRVELAMEGALRCVGLTRQLLAFARHQPLQPQPIDMNSLVLKFAAMARRVVGESVHLLTDFQGEICGAKADPSQLESAILNLVVNARDAMPAGGTITVCTRDASHAEIQALKLAGLAAGDYVALSVNDTGTGISPENLERVFDPFFTTKEVGKGTGLGLSIVYGFVKQSGGHIMIDSELGRGTTVTIYLLKAPEQVIEPHAAAGDEAPLPRAQNGETILAVEDDASVRRFAAETLRELGYHVLEAEDGPSALGMLEKGGRIDLLFTDVAMPGGLSGHDLAAEANRRLPKLKILMTSAYTDRYANDVLRTGSARLLNKPYQDHDLAVSVRAALDRV